STVNGWPKTMDPSAMMPSAPLEMACEYLSSSDTSGRLVTMAAMVSAAKNTTVATSSSLMWLTWAWNRDGRRADPGWADAADAADAAGADSGSAVDQAT